MTPSLGCASTALRALAAACALTVLPAAPSALGQSDTSPVKAERLTLLHKEPTRSFRTLRTPIGLDYSHRRHP